MTQASKHQQAEEFIQRVLKSNPRMTRAELLKELEDYGFDPETDLRSSPHKAEPTSTKR